MPRAMLLACDILDTAVCARPRAVAATLGDESMTFSDMGQRARRMANVLVSLGVRRGDRIAWWSEATLDAAPLQFAVGRIGAVFVPLNPAYADDETRQVLKYLDPRLLLVDPVHADRGEQLANELDVAQAVTHGTGPRALDALVQDASPRDPDVPPPGPEDVFTIFMTSGSTGVPKGVMISHRATWLRAFAGSLASATTGGGGQVVAFPLFHMAGWFFAYHAWSAHQPAHFMRRLGGHDLLEAIDRHQPSMLYCIPAVWQRVLAERGTYDTSSLEWAFTGTSRVEPSLLHALRQRFPAARMTVNYGSTEVGRGLSLPDCDIERKPYSVGRPVPGFRAKVSGDGELLLASPTLMCGYYERATETAAVLVDGWYHTGDLVEEDEDGCFSVVGRRRELIRSGGEWIAPAEIEGVLCEFPGVLDAAVVGVPDPQWGEVVCAAVVMASGTTAPSVEAVRQFLSGRLAPFKHPRRVVTISHVPRTPATGQPQRARLVSEMEPS